MRLISRTIMAAMLSAALTSPVWALDLNPGNSGGGREPIATPTYEGVQNPNPALTTGSRFSVTKDTPAYENPTVPGATGDTIVRGDRSTISGNRRGTIQQKTGGPASDTPG